VKINKTLFLDLFMIQLETYRGTKSRHTCPQCGKRHKFTRFINTETGEYLPGDVGICDRVSSCGYRYTAKQYFADNPTASKLKPNPYFKERGRKLLGYFKIPTNSSVEIKAPAFDFIAPEHLTATLLNYDQNAFVQFLFDLFPDCSNEIQTVLKMYFVGTWKDGLTVFWQIDRRGKIRTGKIMRYDAQNGHRQIVRTWTDKDGEKHELKVDWMHGKIKKDFNLTQIFFGEHLLSKYPDKPVAIVESEKTAIIASLCMSQFVWLATGSKQWLKAERLQRLDNRQIILYPDADGFDDWQNVAAAARAKGLNVVVSDLIEKHATAEQKANGFDLADYLIEQQTEINKTNAKIEMVLNDESLFADFETILAEQKAIILYDGEQSEIEAERICTRPENLRRIITKNY
jgi:hypothetical protein